jgi:hypothetical protein
MSAFSRLVELSQLEGVDVATAATNLLLYQLGAYSAARLARRQTADDGPNTTVAAVCLTCARTRTDPSQSRCVVCGGSWTTAIR